MVEVKVRPGENMENALRRFKKICEREGIFSEIKKREYYDKPSVRRKKKALEAQKRNNKNRGSKRTKTNVK